MQRHHSFSRTKRLAFGAASLACFGAALALMPEGARSRETATTIDARTAPARAAATPAAIVPSGDAFAPRAELDEESVPRLPSPPPLARVRFAPAPPAAAAPTTQTRVAAIANGAEPVAIVDTGGAQRVVTIGDRIDGVPIESIEDDALVLSGGRRLSLDAASVAR